MGNGLYFLLFSTASHSHTHKNTLSHMVIVKLPFSQSYRPEATWGSVSCPRILGHYRRNWELNLCLMDYPELQQPCKSVVCAVIIYTRKVGLTTVTDGACFSILLQRGLADGFPGHTIF